MKIYDDYVLPHIINCACGLSAIDHMRAKVVPHAKGKVLEVGMGSGLNLAHYDPKQVEMVWGLEPSVGMRRKAQQNIEQSLVPVTWLQCSSELIPLEDASVDTIVLAYTLCTITDWRSALIEMVRVLKKDGVLLFVEHGQSPDKSVQRWQHRLNWLWGRIAGGCNLNRPIPSMIESVGFNR